MAKMPIAALRIAANMTQQELADRIGVSRPTVHAWETGERAMKPYYIYAFCHITGFSEDDILLPEHTT